MELHDPSSHGFYWYIYFLTFPKSITDTPSGRKFEYVPFSEFGQYTSVDEVFP